VAWKVLFVGVSFVGGSVGRARQNFNAFLFLVSFFL
jgi:hypothetical protein